MNPQVLGKKAAPASSGVVLVGANGLAVMLAALAMLGPFLVDTYLPAFNCFRMAAGNRVQLLKIVEEAMTETYIRVGKINWIAKGSDVGVQERILEPGDAIPWHYHTIITDTTYCIEGTVQIEMLGPPERILLAAGQSQAVPTNRPHRITPHGDRPCRFLLVQGVGKYDRHPVDPETWEGERLTAG